MKRRNENLLYSYVALIILLVGALFFAWKWLGSQIGDGVFFSWQNPWAIALSLGAVVLGYCFFHRQRQQVGTFAYSRVGDLSPAPMGIVAKLSSLPSILRVSALVLLAFALARPISFKTETEIVRGIDIMLVLDVSKSMEDRDLRPNRLAAGQCTLHKFLGEMNSDRIGMVVFAKESMLSCPLTLDYETLDDIVADVRIGDVPPLGTAIGDALGLALSSLRRSDAKSKVAILVSDGDSNRSVQFEPNDAKDLAVEMGVKVFTILVGQEKGVSAFGGRHGVDPALLREIAKATGGRYYNAANVSQLNRSFAAIRETLDKTDREILGRTEEHDLFSFFLLPALCFLGLEVLLSLTRWRRFP